MPNLKRSYKTKAEIPTGLETYYTEATDGSGTWMLAAVDGLTQTTELDALNTRIAEFRDNNTGLTRRQEELQTELAGIKTKFDGIDPAAVAQMKTDLEKLKKPDGTELKIGDVPKLITDGIAAGLKPLQTQLADGAAKLRKSEVDGANTRLRSSLTTAALAAKVRKTAIQDAVGRGLSVFKVAEDLSFGAMAADGTTALYSAKDASQRLTPEEYYASLSVNADAAHLFETSAGGGADNPGGGGGVPGARILTNPTDAEVSAVPLKDLAAGKVRIVRTDQ